MKINEIKINLDKMLEDFDRTEALPSPTMEPLYTDMLKHLRKEGNENQDYENRLMYVFVEHYYKPKYKYLREVKQYGRI